MGDSKYGLTSDSIPSFMKGLIRGLVDPGLFYVQVFLDTISILKNDICHMKVVFVK